jgi:TonB family protein
MRKTRHLVACVMLLAWLPPVYAGLTFSDGLKAYDAGDFANAKLTFERLAELGHAGARFNLALLYYQGQGVDKDPLKAYGWLSLAGESGNADAAKIGGRIYEELPPAQRVEADKLRDSLISRYGIAALNASLLPEIKKSDPAHYQIKETKLRQNYPRGLKQLGLEGAVDVEYTISRDGNIKDIHVLEFSHEGFVDAAIRALRYHKYDPPLVDGHNVDIHGYRYRVPFDFESVDAFATRVEERTTGKKRDGRFEGRMDEFIADLLEQARADNPASQYYYGHIMTTHNRVKRITETEMNEWYLKSAQGGFSAAQYTLAYSLLYGRGCVADRAKAIAWLTLASEGDYPLAQLLLGRTLISMREGPEQVQKGLLWIDKAAQNDFPPAAMALAWLQATAGDEKIRNPGNALKLAAGAYEDYPDQVTALETMTAAYAANGDFKKAVKFQEDAIDEAEDLDWNIQPLQLRLDAYMNGKAWHEF